MHAGNRGINSCLRMALCLILSLMTADIRNHVDSSGTCTTHADKQPTESLVSTEAAPVPWHEGGSDLFSWARRDYLVTIDYNSGCFELHYLPEATSETVVGKLMNNFSHHGIPQTLVTDNGPQFSREFSTFVRKWQFVRETNRPVNSHSNGAAEAADDAL